MATVIVFMKDFTCSNNFNLKLAYSICLSFQIQAVADNKDNKLKFSNLKNITTESIF